MLSEQWDKEREREREKEEVETKQGEREWERKQMGVFGPPPLPPFSLHAEPRPCLILLIIFRWPFHTRICQRTRMRLLFPPLFTLFFCHLIKFSCDQTATDVILLPPCFYYLCQTRSTRTWTSPSTFILKLVFWGPKGQGGTMRNQNRERTSVWCYVVFKVTRRHVLLVPMPHQMFPL